MCGLLKASLINHIDLRKGLIELKKQVDLQQRY